MPSRKRTVGKAWPSRIRIDWRRIDKTEYFTARFHSWNHGRSRRHLIAGSPALLSASRASMDALPEASSSAGGGECSLNRLEKASKGYKPRYPGPRWHLVYGSYSGVEEFALNELQSMVQRYVPYVVEIRPASEPLDKDAHHILIGTAANNPQIAERARKSGFVLPSKPQSYSSACSASPLNPERKSVVIAGTDSAGVLYGAVDFNKRLAAITPDDPKEMRQTLDSFPEFSVEEAPLIENRGIWSWGYVIYDYRRFLDNMARLKMNRLCFWNDVPPINCREVIDYAHARGIKVVLGFSWGYDLSTLDPTSKADLEVVKQDVLCQIEHYYRHLGMDAIYFQTFTETSTTAIRDQAASRISRATRSTTLPGPYWIAIRR